MTAIVKSLYLVQPCLSVLSLPQLIQDNHIRWPTMPTISSNHELSIYMNWVPLLFSFKDRVQTFRFSLPSISLSTPMLMDIHRNNLVEDTYNVFRSMIKSPQEFQKRFDVGDCLCLCLCLCLESLWNFSHH